MASDPETPEADEVPDAPVDHEELRSMIREELQSVLDGWSPGGDEGPPEPEDADKPATIRDIEAAMERTMTKAMGDLRAKPRKTPPKAPDKPPPEPPPTDPPKGAWERFKEAAWG